MIGQVLGSFRLTYGGGVIVLFSWTTICPRSGILAYLTPTNNKREKMDLYFLNKFKQVYCDILKNKTKYKSSQ